MVKRILYETYRYVKEYYDHEKNIFRYSVTTIVPENNLNLKIINYFDSQKVYFSTTVKKIN